MGDSDQEQKVVFDTSSDWLTIESSACFTCEGNYYDYNTSNSYSTITVTPVDRYYGYSHLRGIEAQDKVCLTSFSNCINPFTFFMITDQYGLPSEIDGILGLTLGQKNDAPLDFKLGPLFLDKLYEEGHITQKSFSTHFSSVEGNSFVDFGTARDANMNVETKKTIDVDDTFFWQVTPQGVRFTDLDGDVNEFKLDEFKAVLSSASEFTMVPAKIARPFFKKFLRGIKRKVDQGISFVDCSVDLPDVSLLIDGHWYEMKGSALINDMSKNQDGSLCAVGIIPTLDNVWTLGHAFY